MTLRMLPADFRPPAADAVTTRRCREAAPVDAVDGSGTRMTCSRPAGHDTVLGAATIIYHLAGYNVEGKGPTQWCTW